MHCNKSNSYLNILILTIVWIITGCTKNDLTNQNQQLHPVTINYPAYIPQLQIPQDNPLTEEGIKLGKKLYYDPILSNNGLSCSSCHQKSSSFSHPVANSLAHINLGWNNQFLWDGKISGTLEDIMKFEVEIFFATDVSKLNNDAEYKNLFRTVYNVNHISSKEIAYALAQYFRSLYSFESKFDRYLQNKTSLTIQELNGFNIFFTEKGDCFHCHSMGLLCDNSFHNIGIDSVFTGVNKGRFNVTQNPSDIGKFKTPTLRNIAFTAPYMHDGRFTTLDQVIEHYNSGVKQSNTLDPIMAKPSKIYGLQLTTQEKQNLKAFLLTFTDSIFINNPNN